MLLLAPGRDTAADAGRETDKSFRPSAKRVGDLMLPDKKTGADASGPHSMTLRAFDALNGARCRMNLRRRLCEMIYNEYRHILNPLHISASKRQTSYRDQVVAIVQTARGSGHFPFSPEPKKQIDIP